MTQVWSFLFDYFYSILEYIDVLPLPCEMCTSSINVSAKAFGLMSNILNT